MTLYVVVLIYIAILYRYSNACVVAEMAPVYSCRFTRWIELTATCQGLVAHHASVRRMEVAEDQATSVGTRACHLMLAVEAIQWTESLK